MKRQNPLRLLQGLLATADCKDETGFSGRSSYPHTCDIRLFRYSDKTLKFEPAGGYLAKTEYDSAPIIRREMKNIEAYLSGSLPAPVPQGIDESGYVLVKTLPLRKTFNTPETLQASAYEFEAEGKGNHDVGPLAKLCFEGLDLKDGRCFEAKTGGGHGYNVVQELSLVPLFTDKRPRYGILFIAYGIEYNRDRGKIVTLWAYRGKEHGFVNILPSLTFMTDLGAFSLLSTIRPDMEGVVAMASYVSGREEAHYDSHRYKISLYRYNDKAGIFKPIGGFVTKKKYDDTTLESIFYKEMKGNEKLLSRGK
jgi:hypothetical protein